MVCSTAEVSGLARRRRGRFSAATHPEEVQKAGHGGGRWAAGWCSGAGGQRAGARLLRPRADGARWGLGPSACAMRREGRRTTTSACRQGPRQLSHAKGPVHALRKAVSRAPWREGSPFAGRVAPSALRHTHGPRGHVSGAASRTQTVVSATAGEAQDPRRMRSRAMILGRATPRRETPSMLAAGLGGFLAVMQPSELAGAGLGANAPW